ncbi:unnamed protein product, partial [Laminaria digitata]
MFKVQRFTADDEEEENGGHDSTSILDSILQRAKSRSGSNSNSNSNSKRARLEPTTSGGDGGGGIHEDSRANPGASRRAKGRATGDAVSGVAAVGRSAAASSVSVAEGKHGVRLPERDSVRDSVEALENVRGRGGKHSEDSSGSDESDESEDSG